MFIYALPFSNKRLTLMIAALLVALVTILSAASLDWIAGLRNTRQTYPGTIRSSAINVNDIGGKGKIRRIKDNIQRKERTFTTAYSSTCENIPVSCLALAGQLEDQGHQQSDSISRVEDRDRTSYAHVVALEITGTANGNCHIELTISGRLFKEPTGVGETGRELTANLIQKINGDSSLCTERISAKPGENPEILVIRNVSDEEIVIRSFDGGIKVRQFGNPHEPVFALSIIQPCSLYYSQCSTRGSMTAKIYLGNFGSTRSASNIILPSVRVNEIIVPDSLSILSSHPCFTDTVLEIIFSVDEFLKVYGESSGTALHTCTVSGEFLDGTVFSVNGTVYVGR
jgi:hypothetical protein